MQVFRLKDNYRDKNGINYLSHIKNTRDLFYYDGDIVRVTITEEKTKKELVELIQDGKIAIFPIWKNQNMENIIGHIKCGFQIYFMRYSEFTDFKNWYIDNCVNMVIEEVNNPVEELQAELPF